MALAVAHWCDHRLAPYKALSPGPAMISPPVEACPDKPPTTKEPSDVKSADKHELNFVMNKLTLGNFRMDELICKQELIVNKLFQECSFFASTVPRTYKQATKSAQ